MVQREMKRRIFGLENEYGLACMRRGEQRVSPDRAAAAVFDSALPGARHSNAFLENGARLYLDTGSHPEYATPECDDLAELVAHDKAGERIVEDLVRRAERGLRADGIIGRLLVFKNNTDSVGNSYGCHENYLVSRNVPLQRLAEVLIPFLVTRQVFAGAGKVLRTPRGVRYCLSQRAPHICQDICAATTSGRSIINMRDEPLADAERYRRLHLIVGDSNMAEVATYLKVGTTALILDMIEDGSFDRDYSLRSPVQALRDISSDPTLGATVELKDGRTMNALQLQTEYLEGVARHVSSTGANRAAKDVLARWADVIERLRDDPMQLNRELDWVIKLEWIEHYRTRDRLSWCDPKISLIDLQYHDVRHECGIYYRLAAHGRVERVIDDAAIATAIQIPPQTTRARLRGEFIRQARLKGRDYRADWTYLKLEGSGSRAIHCKDPFRAHDDEIERIIESL
jgi:proteasome accessory factor A